MMIVLMKWWIKWCNENDDNEIMKMNIIMKYDNNIN